MIIQDGVTITGGVGFLNYVTMPPTVEYLVVAGGGAGGGGGTSVGSGTYGAGGTGGGGRGGDPLAPYANAGSGVANSGSGGGGAAYTGTAGSGGSGVVIIRYPSGYAAAASTTGSPTITNTGGYRTYKFTSSGSITF